MATKRTTPTQPLRSEAESITFSDWIAQAVDQGVKPEQALAFIGLGLMQRLGANASEAPLVWNDGGDGGQLDSAALRQRLELTDLAIRTGAPLSTAEVSLLLGARPGSGFVERAGLVARRLSRNVWKLSRSNADAERSSYGDAFRRRL
ncbi:hypothetical protein [Cyanobium sp. ATX 6F1]|uniref:hypothetical protein n=1 Tax=unclassified Cyanobium TaxID=2627006 RepID=UPI0039657864